MSDAIPGSDSDTETGTKPIAYGHWVRGLIEALRRLWSGEDFDPQPIFDLLFIAGITAVLVGAASIGLVFANDLELHRAGVGVGYVMTGVTAIVAAFSLENR